MGLFENIREKNRNPIENNREKLFGRAENLFDMMNEEERNKAKQQILLNLLWKIEQEITTFLSVAVNIWIFTSEEEIRKIWKLCEKSIVESDIYKKDISESKTFLKNTFPKMIDIICTTLSTKVKRLWKL